jgi:hypothetical protein
MMMLGGFVAASDRRFRRELAADSEAQDAAPGVSSPAPASA